MYRHSRCFTTDYYSLDLLLFVEGLNAFPDDVAKGIAVEYRAITQAQLSTMELQWSRLLPVERQLIDRERFNNQKRHLLNTQKLMEDILAALQGE